MVVEAVVSGRSGVLPVGTLSAREVTTVYVSGTNASGSMSVVNTVGEVGAMYESASEAVV